MSIEKSNTLLQIETNFKMVIREPDRLLSMTTNFGTFYKN